MYHLLAGLYAELTRKPVYNVLLVGLKGSGKTWILEKLRELYLDGSGPSARIAPTVGQNVLDVTYKRSILRLWDLGGAKSMRSLWDQYLPDAHVLVWVLDAPRWVHDSLDDEGPYRSAMCTALFRLVQEAAARNQPIVLVISQLDRLAPDASGPGLVHASSASLQEHVHTTILKQWALFVDEAPAAATLNPNWNVAAVSAATGYVQDLRSDGMRATFETIHTHAVRFGESTPAP
ncbi:ADP-ribosylation factor protein 3 [Malassezia obtusa]|uniref:ADP-ribosylation factor protein 3 n=1 Tax=Malassezia obtusa TaxID=76774 RepID=A0AAF0E0P3_9BASI|nr:ADP-ribosylation factor protein 3 [Malassezia obtusa]